MARTRITTWLPRATRSAVSSDLAKPRNPPTPVRPEGLAAWAGSAALPSVRPEGESTGPEPAPDAVKMSVADTRGAGSTATRRTAATATRAPAASMGRHGTPAVCDTDCHIATRPQTQQATQARTQTPSARSTDWAAATAIRATEPASE